MLKFVLLKEKPSMISRLSSECTPDQLSKFSPDLKLPDSLICSKRIHPKDYVNIYINGRPEKAVWGLIPSTASNDLQQHNRIGIRTKDLGNSPTYRLLSRRNRAFLFVNAFYHNTIKGGQRTRHRIMPKERKVLAIPVIYDRWTDPDDHKSYITFSIVHQDIESKDQRIPGLVPVLFEKEEQVKHWLDLEHLPHEVQWPKFEVSDFEIKSVDMDVKMHPAFQSVVPTDSSLPDNFKNIA